MPPKNISLGLEGLRGNYSPTPSPPRTSPFRLENNRDQGFNFVGAWTSTKKSSPQKQEVPKVRHHARRAGMGSVTSIPTKPVRSD